MNEMKKISLWGNLWGNVYGFSINYGLADIKDLFHIHDYLIRKHSIKQYFSLLNNTLVY